MRAPRPVVGVITLLLVAPVVLGGQTVARARVGLSPQVVETSRHDVLPLRFHTPPPTYWKEGGLLTSLITIVAANIWVRDVSVRQRVFGSVALGSVFFVPGALIGGQISKRPNAADSGGADSGGADPAPLLR